MTLHNKSIGKIGEDYAAEYLKKNGYLILARNYNTSYGEIDIIARKGDKIFFIEVKTRSSLVKGKPYEAVNFRKMMHLKSACTLYLLKNRIKGCKLSLDTISIVLKNDQTIGEFQYFENIIS